MSMNSFSARAARRRSENESYESEISGVLELHCDGDVFPFEHNSKIPYSPLDFSELREEWTEQSGRRATPRYELAATVLIANHQKAFRTQSVNVSATGLLLKDLLPDEFSSHKFEIVLIQHDPSGKKTFYFFRGRAVDGPLRSRRIKFEALNKDSEVKLQKLFRGLPRAA